MARQLHDAAAYCKIDEFLKIAEKEEILKSINEKDKDEDTPILKAVKKANIEAVVALVAFGANVNIPDQNKKTPLHIALENKSTVIAQLLCSLETHDKRSEWLIEMQRMYTHEGHDRKDDDTMLKTLLEKLSAFHQRLIKSAVVNIKSKISMSFEDLEITIEPTHHDAIFLWCMQMKPEYADFCIPPNHRFFGDIFEFQGWTINYSTIRVNLIFPKILQPNERISVFPLAGNVLVNYSLSSQDKLKKRTNLMIDIYLEQGKTVRFAVLAIEFNEIFDVPRNGIKISPQMEPDSCIIIKPETFKKDLQMTVNFIDTKIKDEDNNSNILMTNLLKVTLCPEQHPSKDIEIMLPLHTVSMSVTILFSNKIQPEAESDWMECSAQVDVQAKKVTFPIRAFKWIVAALSNVISDAKKEASQLIKGEKTIDIFAMLKNEHTFYKLVVGFSSPKHLPENKEKWIKWGYSFQSEKETSLCKNKQYKISFSGDIEVVQQEDETPYLVFDLSRQNINYRIFQVRGCGQRTVPTGQVYIGKPVPKSLLDRFSDLFKKTTPTESLYTFKDLLFLPIDVAENSSQKKDPIRYKKVEVKVDPTDPLCTIPVLRKSSLKRIGSLLTKNECYRLGEILRIQTSTLETMQNKDEFQHKLFEEWRSMHKLPNNALAGTLEEALKEIGRIEEANVVKQAFTDGTEFNIL